MAISIEADALATVLDRAPPGVKILSLDCFDTLIWRNTHAPRDVFADLSFCSPRQRIAAEVEARQRAGAKGRPEVKIAEIYAALFPNTAPASRDRMIQEELNAEARHCFAFRPTVDLIRDAKAKGLKVIVVSDTYLGHGQLRGLIAGAAGRAVADLIDQIFCSSDYGVCKAGGLFAPVLRALNIAPAKILHLGDNRIADYQAPIALGLNAVHFSQFDSATEQQLRLEAASSVLLHSHGLRAAPTLQPHRAQLSLKRPLVEQGAATLGYATLGPILYAFAHWLRREAAEISAARGGRVKVLFLMRDGFLPKRAYDAVATADDPQGVEIEISRLTAGQAGLTSKAAILKHMETWLGMEPELVVRQCLLTPEEGDELLAQTQAHDFPLRLGEAIRQPRMLAKISGRSRAFADRLIDYVRREVNPEPGDTLMLVDLGYNATVQNRIDGVLSDAFGVHVAGRYMLLREHALSGLDKRGLIDDRHYDPSALESLCAYIAVVEQLCTAARGSVIDYDASGPIRGDTSIKGGQSAVRDAVQAGCLDYMADAGAAIWRAPASLDARSEREAAAAALARLLFLPSASELEVLKSFQHDMNWGSDEAVKLFDQALGGEGLKRWGMFYLKGARRMYLSAELRGQGFANSLSLFAQARFDLDLKYPDFCDRTISLPILVAQGAEVTAQTVQANPTHDGYFLAGIPIGDCQFAIAVLFGQLYEWVQIESVGFLPVNQFLGKAVEEEAAMTPAAHSFEGMSTMSADLMRCQDPNGFMLAPPPPRTGQGPMMLAVVFRPIAAWNKAEIDARIQAEPLAQAAE
jgi:FMN phosphatase YigB (HAD superfamily)